MATALPGTPAEHAADAGVRVMQLRVWLDADAAWRASLVLPDGQVLEFSSPLTLARHLSRLLGPRLHAGSAGPGDSGLR